MVPLPRRLARLPRAPLAVPGADVRVAATARARLLGLAGLRAVPPGAGLLLPRTRSVHTVGMRMPIDLVWIDARARVVGVDAAVAPWRLRACRAARHVLELPAHTAAPADLQPGSTIAARMASSGDHYRNPVTGQEITFLATTAQTGGAYLEVETTYAPGGPRPPAHLHPRQAEHFEVLEGEVSARVGGERRTLHAGDTLEIAAGAPHEMACAGDAPARMRWRTTPALRTEAFFETMWGLAEAGKINRRGVPGLLQIVASGQEFADEFRLVRPAWTTQRVLFALLGPIARARGVQGVYTPPTAPTEG